MTVWKTNHVQVDRILAAGDAAMSGSLANTAVSSQAGGRVRFTTTDDPHGYRIGSQIYIAGSTNYEGTHTIVATPGTDTFDVVATYVAETPAGSGAEPIGPTLAPGVPFQLQKVSCHLWTPEGNAEDLVMEFDSSDDTNYDRTWNLDFSSSADVLYTPDHPERTHRFQKNDLLFFTFANSSNITWALDVEFLRGV